MDLSIKRFHLCSLKHGMAQNPRCSFTHANMREKIGWFRAKVCPVIDQPVINVHHYSFPVITCHGIFPREIQNAVNIVFFMRLYTALWWSRRYNVFICNTLNELDHSSGAILLTLQWMCFLYKHNNTTMDSFWGFIPTNINLLSLIKINFS